MLVNNAGLAVPETVAEITDEGWDKVMETNLRGAMWLVRAALPRHDRDRISATWSMSRRRPASMATRTCPPTAPRSSACSASAEALRDDVRKSGANIRVFNFCPGLVDVEHTGEDESPRAGAIHVRNMARTLMFALSLDRDVVLEDINIYKR